MVAGPDLGQGVLDDGTKLGDVGRRECAVACCGVSCSVGVEVSPSALAAWLCGCAAAQVSRAPVATAMTAK